MRIKQELLGIIDALDDAGLEYAICGGFAVALHGYPRLTRDIDLLVCPDQLDAGTACERVVQRVSKCEGHDFLTLDLLLVTPFLQDVWDQRMTFVMENRRVTAVSRDGLIKMKRSAARPQDLADIESLESE